MNLQRSLQILSIYVFAALLILSGCSVYKSSGRKTFENRAPANVQTAASYPAESLNEKTTCWNQPVTDPLWEVDPNLPLTVTAVSEDEIEVCSQAE